MSLWRSAAAALAVAMACAPLCAQEASPGKANLSFAVDFPGSTIPHYVILLTADGSGTYEASGEGMDVQGPVTFHIAPAAAAELFRLVHESRDLAGDPGDLRNVAFSGTKTVTWTDGVHPPVNTHFVVSSKKPLQSIAARMQALANTLHLGVLLSSDLRFHPVQLDRDMEAVASELKDSVATHPEAIADTLRRVAADPAVIGKVRRQAETILDGIPAER